jgi:hypothetical protein
MFKQFSIVAVLITLSLNSFAQEEIQKEEPTKDVVKSQFADFVMLGFSVGLEFGSMNADLQVKYKDILTGTTTKLNASTDEGASVLGVSLSYAKLPRGDLGVIAGATLLKKLTDNAQSDKATIANSSELVQLRPELGLAYAFSNGIYASAGGNLSLLKIDSDSISKLGYGIQLMVGYVPVQNFGVDIGYYISRHLITSLNGLGANQTLETSESYYDFKTFRGRVSYYF